MEEENKPISLEEIDDYINEAYTEGFSSGLGVMLKAAIQAISIGLSKVKGLDPTEKETITKAIEEAIKNINI